ncbi:hypothetical protein AWENTII_010438 [Aspergillus wentii]
MSFGGLHHQGKRCVGQDERAEMHGIQGAEQEEQQIRWNVMIVSCPISFYPPTCLSNPPPRTGRSIQRSIQTPTANDDSKGRSPLSASQSKKNEKRRSVIHRSIQFNSKWEGPYYSLFCLTHALHLAILNTTSALCCVSLHRPFHFHTLD